MDLSSQGRMRMYNDATTSDLTVHFCDRSIYAHKAILSERSEVFYRAFYGPFAETSSYTIACEEYDVQAIEALLKHIYSFPYREPVDVELNLDWYLQLYLIAVEYWVDSFETTVVHLIEAEVFLSVPVINHGRKFRECCRQIEGFYDSYALPMSLFYLMDGYINASDKYRIDKQEIIKEKIVREQRRAVEYRTRSNRSTSLESGKVGERNEADRLMVRFEEVLANLDMANRKGQIHEKKKRSKKNRHAHAGRAGFQTELEEDYGSAYCAWEQVVVDAVQDRSDWYCR
ncbi:unnamed protein product [Aureobasidium mustum]|uniref:BTB domain-containing protein n=1 Tax=Aureobasidium mustum TaxID=2773714 RepID=A0A9N8PLS8_9PEZI|nr:unnamed protein product [Aureobasidium mustum]